MTDFDTAHLTFSYSYAGGPARPHTLPAGFHGPIAAIVGEAISFYPLSPIGPFAGTVSSAPDAPDAPSFAGNTLTCKRPGVHRIVLANGPAKRHLEVIALAKGALDSPYLLHPNYAWNGSTKTTRTTAEIRDVLAGLVRGSLGGPFTDDDWAACSDERPWPCGAHGGLRWRDAGPPRDENPLVTRHGPY